MNVKLSEHLPAHIRKQLEAASDSEQAQTDTGTEQPPSGRQTEPPSEETLPVQTVPYDDGADETVPPPQTSEADAPDAADDDDPKLANDLAAMKGRLKKVQEERDRLAAAAQNGAFATAKLMEMQERAKALENELAALKQPKQPEAPAATPAAALSEEDKAELVAELGESLGSKLAALLERPVPQAADADDVAALRQEMWQREQQAHEQRWFAAVQENIPEFQGLVQTNALFLDFLRDKKDWAGNSAFDAVGYIGKTMDIDKIPTIRTLIDEFNQAQAAQQAEKTKRVANAPPAGGGGSTAAQPGRKRRMTAADRAKMRQLERKPGGRDEYLAFMEQFE